MAPGLADKADRNPRTVKITIIKVLYLHLQNFRRNKKSIMKLSSCALATLILGALLLGSCSTPKNIAYFQDLTDTSRIYTQAITESYEARIQPDDIIEIIVNSINPEATAIFNLGNNNIINAPSLTNTVNSGVLTKEARAGTPSGYLVNKDGVIDFPVLGKLIIKGLTISQLKDSLARRLDVYLKDPIINVRLVNYKITVLGEVTKPAAYILQSERISIIDAIGMAGDLTIFGRRENVLLIREENGQRNFIRLNLNSSKIFESKYYYLKQNDVVYVEPGKSKIAATDTRTIRNISILSSVVTLLVVLITRL